MLTAFQKRSLYLLWVKIYVSHTNRTGYLYKFPTINRRSILYASICRVLLSPQPNNDMHVLITVYLVILKMSVILFYVTNAPCRYTGETNRQLNEH